MQQDPEQPVSYHHLLRRPGEDPEEAERRLTVASVSIDEPCPWCGVLIHSMITPWAADNGYACPSCSGALVRLGPERSRGSAMGLYVAHGGGAILLSSFLIFVVVMCTIVLLEALQTAFISGLPPDSAVLVALVFVVVALGVSGLGLQRSLVSALPALRSIARLARGRKFVASIGASIEPSPLPKRLETRRTDETLDGALQIHTDVVGEEHRGGLSQAHEAGSLELKDPPSS